MKGKKLKIPRVQARRPYDDDRPSGYVEGDRDYMENNLDACVWFLDNHKAVRAALKEVK